MTADTRSEEQPAAVGGAKLKSAARRRLFRGAAGGAGVLLTVHAKTALGGALCQSPSANMSGNSSPRPGQGATCSGGRSPGFWMQPQHFPHWRQGIQEIRPPMFDNEVVDCTAGLGKLKWSDITDQGTTFQSVFGVEPARASVGTYPGEAGLWAVMAFKNGFQGGIFMFHMIAAYLNANYFREASAKYPMTPEQVVEMWTATASGGKYCPSSFVVESCPGGGWNADEVKAYIEGMYHDNDPVPNLCKPDGT